MATCCNSHSLNGPILAIIFDLDGTLLDTERATNGVMKEFLAKYGKVLDSEKESKRSFGKTLKESSISRVNDYNLPLTPDQFIDEIIPMYQQRWSLVKALPGANRLMKHLHSLGIPFALASNSTRDYIDSKISYHKGWKEYFSVILGSDQVNSGKPAPDLFEEAAKRLGVDSTRCLVIEDSLVGVKAGKAAKMAVVAVPPRGDVEAQCRSLANTVLLSLLEFQPELWGLPPFQDWIGKALPIEPIYTSGLYANGLFHDVREDGISSLPDQVFGVFFGCAQLLDTQNVFTVVVLIGIDRQKQIYRVNGVNAWASNQKMKLELLGYIKAMDNKENTCMDTVVEEYKSIARASMALSVFTQNSIILSLQD